MEPLLQVNDLHVSFQTVGGEVKAVRGVTFHLNKGETLAIVGESGSGKSVTALSTVRLIPSPPGKIKKGEIVFQGKDLVKLTEREMFKVRGSEIGMIFQDPMTSLNPTMPVGKQIIEGIRWHQKIGVTEAKNKAIEMLKLVGIPNPEKRVSQYPYEFSGGMRQRVMIALALASNPKILIADEPTTALDVTIQAQIMSLMKDLQEKTETAIILITHDLGVVAETAERVAVMYGGVIVETGPVNEIFHHSRHPYTWGLLASMPRLDLPKAQQIEPIPGSPPDLFDPPAGCPFADRCPHAMNVCLEEMPPVTQVSSNHQVACWLEDPEAPSVERGKINQGTA
ncbi:ABC transporter ATP-binding protein [Paenactinomyces guangxiensis]|uniref:ABC transporter ATP-binding protein n=1 Tax=Paenactinomyces guangxiensis TaxID=1490290 RepID=A0A7W2A8W1_9BACL|nr:ABC transporter ATP-binding protein [Paenactinomyces guangxiensis]MBA4494614.1 ABC transporter ATP-binding protein [Paenactinomyces guangxiensis]MBH8591623.1 ABC transporter ATP-binding protein [Paenactinomyces guangxiensis]